MAPTGVRAATKRRNGSDRMAGAGISVVDRPLHRASTLPRDLFTDSAVYAREMQRLFHRTWQCVGRSDDVPNPGDHRTFEIGGSGVLLLRDEDGTLRAFHNVCRHRGTRIVEAEAGQGLHVLQCPYHAWSYNLRGELVGAPHMELAENFDRRDFGLYPVGLAEWRGFVFLTMDPDPEPLKEYLGAFVDRARPYPLERLRRAQQVTYEIAANWKFVVQNANECYHCPGVHPQLVRMTPYRSGEEDMRDGPVFGGWMDFVDGVTSLTASGVTGRPIFPGLSELDRRRVYYYVLYPSNFLSLLPDYVTLDWFIPLGPDRTRLVFDLYVDRDEVDPAADAISFWDVTNRQDWHICEMAHLGARTVGYTQGRYSSEEEVVHAIDRYYVRRVGLLRRRRPRSRAAAR